MGNANGANKKLKQPEKEGNTNLPKPTAGGSSGQEKPLQEPKMNSVAISWGAADIQRLDLSQTSTFISVTTICFDRV